MRIGFNKQFIVCTEMLQHEGYAKKSHIYFDIDYRIVYYVFLFTVTSQENEMIKANQHSCLPSTVLTLYIFIYI